MRRLSFLIGVAICIAFVTPLFIFETTAASEKTRKDSKLNPAVVNTTPQTLPFSQDWSNPALITVNNDWTSVPGIVGYRGDDLVTVVNADPRQILADGSNTPINVIANSTNPGTLTSGGYG